jgi:hypothetical protein
LGILENAALLVPRGEEGSFDVTTQMSEDFWEDHQLVETRFE